MCGLLSSLSGSEVHTYPVHTRLSVLQPALRYLNHYAHTFSHFPLPHPSQASSERAAELCLAEVEAQLLVLNAQRVELAASAAATREDMPINGMERGKYVRGGRGRGTATREDMPINGMERGKYVSEATEEGK